MTLPPFYEVIESYQWKTACTIRPITPFIHLCSSTALYKDARNPCWPSGRSASNMGTGIIKETAAGCQDWMNETISRIQRMNTAFLLKMPWSCLVKKKK